MLPLVGDLAPVNKRASCLSLVISGLSLGILVARLLSGIIANYTDWRNVYWCAFGAQWCLLILLFLFMPEYPSKNPERMNWFKFMYSILHLFRTEPLLVQVCIIGFIMGAIYTSLWTTLSFLLSSPPFNYSSLVIGFFALIGIVIIFAGPLYSILVIDKMQPLHTCLIGIGIELIGVAIGTFIGTFTVAGPILEAITIDLGSQACNIANRARITGLHPKATNRVNTCYMISSFTGQLTGTAVGNSMYAAGGWHASGIFNIVFLGSALLVCIARGPRETRWLGWHGGWSMRLEDMKHTTSSPNNSVDADQEAAR
jgi:predicted MFS family arabinose efflux permease